MCDLIIYFSFFSFLIFVSFCFLGVILGGRRGEAMRGCGAVQGGAVRRRGAQGEMAVVVVVVVV